MWGQMDSGRTEGRGRRDQELRRRRGSEHFQTKVLSGGLEASNAVHGSLSSRIPDSFGTVA